MDNHGECPKPKRSKSCIDEHITNSNWALLPSLVLHQIFDLLGAEDRINASIVCKHWRSILFHPKWWPSVRFKIEYKDIPKAKFYSTNFGSIVTHATIILNPLSPSCINEFILLLRLLKKNNNLDSLVLQPSHCRLEDTLNSIIRGENDLTEILNSLISILPRLSHFSLGGLEDLAHYSNCFLQSVTPSKITSIGLASIKDDITIHEDSCIDPDLISSFICLQVLSIDYDQLSDQLLENLKEVKKLRRIVVHLHAIPKNHQGTSNQAWRDFRTEHPECRLRLTVIHAYNAIHKLHIEVLREEMPLSHLKVFFCEDVNLELLHTISKFYKRTFQSVTWIDSMGDYPSTWKFARNAESPDPFVLMSWLCVKFEELVLYGYKYPEENLVAIGRLKGAKMKRVEIPAMDILPSGYSYGVSPIKEIAKKMQSAWNPLYEDDLHPVILDPESGDSDEFMLPIVLADLN